MLRRSFIALLLGWVVAYAGSVAAGQGLLIAPVKVISVRDGSVATERALWIRDGLIERIGDASGLETGDAVRRIDGGGAYVIPGLAEMHAHVPSRDRGEQYAQDVLRLYLANGITTIRGMLGEAWHLQLREWLSAGRWVGPGLITSGPSLNGRSVNSPAQGAEMVRRQFEAGYDFLKLHPGLEAAEFEAIANTARELGIPFAGHVSADVGLDAALRHGQATIDHLDGYARALVPETDDLRGERAVFFGINLSPAFDTSRAAQLAMATAFAGVWNVPTQSLLENAAGDRPLDALLDRPSMRFVSPSTRERWVESARNLRAEFPLPQRQDFLAARRLLIRELQDARAGLLLGSDAPQIMNVPGFSIHEELAYLVNAGLSPLQALQSGTLNVARFFGETDRGEVREGFVADLLLLEANPLEQIRASRGIRGVLRGGKWYGRATLDAWLDEIADRGI